MCVRACGRVLLRAWWSAWVRLSWGACVLAKVMARVAVVIGHVAAVVLPSVDTEMAHLAPVAAVVVPLAPVAALLRRWQGNEPFHGIKTLRT